LPISRSQAFACFRYHAAVRLLAEHASHFALAYRVTSSGATGDPASPPEVTRDSSAPCRPQSPCFWWVNEKRLRLPIAGSTLPHPRPTSSSSGWRPSITARHFSSCPSDSASRRTPCPPGIAERWLQVRLGCVRLSSSCPFRLLHTFPSSRPARSYPRLWIRRSSSERRRDFNPPDLGAAQRTLCPLLTSPPRSRALRPAQSDVPDTPEISRGKIDRLHRTPAGFTTPALDGRGLRDHLLARPTG